MAPKSERTNALIVKSLEELLKTTPFEKITVFNICNNIGINASTFYRYFSDKYEVMYIIFSQMIDYLFDNTNSIHDGITKTINFINENQSFIHHISPRYQDKPDLYPEFRKMIQHIAIKKINQASANHSQFAQSIQTSSDPEMVMSFLTSGILNVIRYFDDKSNNISADELTAFLNPFIKTLTKMSK